MSVLPMAALTVGTLLLAVGLRSSKLRKDRRRDAGGDASSIDGGDCGGDGGDCD